MLNISDTGKDGAMLVGGMRNRRVEFNMNLFM